MGHLLTSECPRTGAVGERLIRMKRLLLLFIAIELLGSGDKTASHVREATATQTNRSLVLVELFTSEGCSSCPPADELLKKLEVEQPVPNAEIVALEEHVDYWNHEGWTDPFSSADWTSRQQEYVGKFKEAGPATPQMVVDGEKELLGNGIQNAQHAIEEVSQSEKVPISISSMTRIKSNEEALQVEVANTPGTSDQNRAEIWLAVTEQGLHTNVKAGENQGRSWAHASVARSLQKIGSITQPAPFSLQHRVKLRPEWKQENLRIVIFIQDRKSRKILGGTSKKVLEAGPNG